MIKLATALPANTPKTKESMQVAYFYAAVILVLALRQLFDFDGFLKTLVSYNLPGGEVTAHLIGGLIVVFEVFSLPFLLRIRLSPLMRVVSMVCCWLVALTWLKLALWLVFSTNTATNFAILGSVQLSPGGWTIFVSIALGVLAVWASWGLWSFPMRNNAKK